MKYAMLIHYEARPHRRAVRGRVQGDARRVHGSLRRNHPGMSPAPSCSRSRPPRQVRVQDGQTLMTDGPFADTKEIFGGFYLFEADNLDGRSSWRRGSRRRVSAARSSTAVRGALALLEQVFRDEWGRVLACLIGFLGDFDLAEEAAQEAFAVAAERWPRDGVPANPGAWLTVTARNRAIDRIRRERTLAEKTRRAGGPEADEDELRRRDPGRAARADLHLLPSRAGARGAGCADAARARRPVD